MKLMVGWDEAAMRSVRRVFSATVGKDHEIRG